MLKRIFDEEGALGALIATVSTLVLFGLVVLAITSSPNLDLVQRQFSAQSTLLLATHEMGFARDVASTVAFLHQGHVLEAGPPSSIFDTPQKPRTQQFLQRVTEAGRL